MALPIVAEANTTIILDHTIDGDPFDVLTRGWLSHGNVEECFSIPVVKREGFPFSGETRFETQLIDFQLQAEQGFRD